MLSLWHPQRASPDDRGYSPLSGPDLDGSNDTRDIPRSPSQRRAHTPEWLEKENRASSGSSAGASRDPQTERMSPEAMHSLALLTMVLEMGQADFQVLVYSSVFSLVD